MGLMINISPENRGLILVTRQVSSGAKYERLKRKAVEGRWRSEPPVVISPMPDSYKGRFRFHLYHGTHRFTVASEGNLGLRGLIVKNTDDIPRQEAITAPSEAGPKIWTPDERLEAGLRVYLGRNLENVQPGSLKKFRDPSYNLEALLEELRTQEESGLIVQSHLQLTNSKHSRLLIQSIPF